MHVPLKILLYVTLSNSIEFAFNKQAGEAFRQSRILRPSSHTTELGLMPQEHRGTVILLPIDSDIKFEHNLEALPIF